MSHPTSPLPTPIDLYCVRDLAEIPLSNISQTLPCSSPGDEYVEAILLSTAIDWAKGEDVAQFCLRIYKGHSLLGEDSISEYKAQVS